MTRKTVTGFTPTYTVPRVNVGAKQRSKQEQAKCKWFVEFTYNGKRTRLSNQLNRLKDYNEKLDAFNALKDVVHQQLKDGVYGMPVEKPVVIPSVKDAVKAFIKWHKDKGSRLKTIQSYQSKLNYFTDELGDTPVNYIYHKDVDDLLITLSKDLKWSPKTFNNAKGVYTGLFQFCIDSRYIDVNPCSRVKTKYVGKSSKNKAFSKDDFNAIMVEVEKDVMLSMFVKSIYYTCIRPKELTQLQVRHIDFDKRIISIPSDISKNKKDGVVHIDDNYYDLLKEYYFNAPSNAYLFCNDTILWGNTPYQANRPYKRFVKILSNLGLDNKGYTLYSVKHYSNVQKYLAGFTVAEIMICNRHHSLAETENYLRHLVEFVDVSKKLIPSI
ncbi:tyrosine-type recombinase/integrase [Sphingobacterium daejeonense]|uniref:tyrosine-type recombinase/integrase n=1 Tax=Sphingobacterium daejeonense TaxID=371142 RepID=UPI0010C40EAD|nr:site-specific integrase [Sphingobacterium daejeonense]VTP97800.1 Putative prophage CPS-53 integrase [Sphingobacterium daejeonense]